MTRFVDRFVEMVNKDDIPNIQKELKKLPIEQLLNDKHADILSSNPENYDPSSQSARTSDINSNSSMAQDSRNLIGYSKIDSQGVQKYSLREVRPIIKPFQHKIKMRERYTRCVEPPKELENMCKLCCKIFKTYSSYMNHLRQHSSTVTTYTCAQCEETFPTNKELWDHKIEGHKEANCFLCQKCQLAFSDHYTYLLHTIRHMKKPYQCPECHVTSITYKSLAAHISTHFNPLVKCHLCNKEVRQKTLQLHLKSHQGIIQCVECGKVCKDNASYKYHLNYHTGVKPHQCLFCGKGFSKSSHLKVHTTCHTGVKRFKCHQCQRQFKQATDLYRHKEGHEAEGKYECDYCKKKFKGKESLKYHIRKHTNFKPYKCPNCKMSFTMLVSLRSHIKYSHVVTKEHVCEVCEVGFHTRSHYLRHLKSKRHLQNAFYLENKESTEK